MAKNPVFPLYYNDIDRSTRDWTDEEFGAYVRLLVHQWDKGCLPKSYQRLTKLATSLDTNWEMLKKKFEETSEGFKNIRLEEIRATLLKHKRKQKENVEKRYQKSTKQSTKNLPLEDENEIERILSLIRDADILEKGVDEKFVVMIVLKMIEIFKKHFPKYPVNKDFDFPACLQIAYKIADLKKWKKVEVVNGKMQDCLDSWENIVEFVSKDEWLSTRSIYDIGSDKEWPRLVQKMAKTKKKDEVKSDAPPLTTIKPS